MWIPKSNEEIKNENIKKEKSARKTGIYSALFFFFFLLIIYKFVGTKRGLGDNTLIVPTMTWSEIMNYMPFHFFLCIFIGLSFYLYNRKFRQVSSLLCDSCGEIKRFDKIKDCDCGGHFVMLDDMKWIENIDEKENKHYKD